jgi:hypothetical protein
MCLHSGTNRRVVEELLYTKKIATDACQFSENPINACTVTRSGNRPEGRFANECSE